MDGDGDPGAGTRRRSWARAGHPRCRLDQPPVTPAPLRSDRQHTNRVSRVTSQETSVMPEQPKPQPKPQEPTADTRERARAALQMSMDRRG